MRNHPSSLFALFLASSLSAVTGCSKEATPPSVARTQPGPVVPMPPPSEEPGDDTVRETAEEKPQPEAQADREEESKAGKPAAAPAAAAAPKPEEGGKVKALKTSFEYKDPFAKSVRIAGTFTSWKEKALVKKSGVWKTDIYILPGTYPYHFIVNGKNKADPGKPKTAGGDSLVTVQ